MESSSQDGDGVRFSPRNLPDSSVEYLLLLLGPSTEGQRGLRDIEVVRKAAEQMIQDIAKGYIWQRDEFHLDVQSENGNALVPLR